MDVGPHNVQTRCAGGEPHAVLPALAHDLRLFQRQLFDTRHHNAVAGGFHLVKGRFDLIVGALCLGQADHTGQ